MLESLTAIEKFAPVRPQPESIPAIDEHGRIRLPGFPAGLSIEAYLPLVHLYAKVLEASRILDRYRDALRLPPVAGNASVTLSDNVLPQSPLTPLSPSFHLPHLYYKREDQTITQAYKVRGAVVGMAKLMESQGYQCFLAVSTGNHALGVLKAAALLKPQSVRLVVPENTTPGKLDKLQAAIAQLTQQGILAELRCQGATFDAARNWALAQSHPEEAYLDPYGDPWVVAGQGTLGLELISQLAQVLQQPHSHYEEVVVVAPIGGGGLLTGTATALRLASAWEPAFRNVNLRFLGLRLASLDAPLGDAIRVAAMAEDNRLALQALNVSIHPLTQPEMQQGVAWVKRDLQRAVEGASGGTVAPALHHPDYQPSARRLTVSVLSGANCTG